MGSPANAGLCCQRIDGRYVADLHLSTCFPHPQPRQDVLVEKSLFFRFCRAFMRNVQDKPGGKLFSAQP